MEAGYRVHLANPAAMQQYSGLKYSDDHSDARWLAHLLRLGVLPTGYIYPKAERAVRDLLRKRAHLVRQHTSNVLSVQNIMVRNTVVSLNCRDEFPQTVGKDAPDRATHPRSEAERDRTTVRLLSRHDP